MAFCNNSCYVIMAAIKTVIMPRLFLTFQLLLREQLIRLQYATTNIT